jgi:hypothetical protein
MTFYVSGSLLAEPLFGCHRSVSALLLKCLEHHNEFRCHDWHDWRNYQLLCFLWPLMLAPLLPVLHYQTC